MTKQKNTRRSLFVSVIALVCCFAMLLGTTFAWFTDSVSSEGNTIQSGTLKIDLSHKTGEDAWTSLKKEPGHKVFNYEHWEPGYTRVEALKVENLGSLALKYQLSLEVAVGSADIGENNAKLSDVIQVYYTNSDPTLTSYADIKNTWTHAGTLSDVMNSPATFIGGQLTPDGEQGDEQLYTIALHMDETAGNEYQNLSVGNIYVNLVATQWTYESDAFDENYDKDAVLPLLPGQLYYAASPVTAVDGKVDSDVNIGKDGDMSTAVVPAGVVLEDGATEVALNIAVVEDREAVVEMNGGDVAIPLDVHVDGVADSNTVPIRITIHDVFPKNYAAYNIKLYHVENGQTVAMTSVDTLAELDAHNEYYYDAATGVVTLSMATFSEVTATVAANNPWDGEAVDTTWYNETAIEFTLTEAASFAGFRNLVDLGNTFEGKTVKLGADINLGNHNFDPIGWGYVDTAYNRDEADGKVFKGTFDGDGHTISNLYQNGWDLESNGTDYTYTNCGFGLFAAAADATFKNLTITGADIVAECVEMGILVGLSQGNCTYENIKIYDSKIANYQRATGGLIGEVSPLNGAGTTTIKDVTIGSDVVVGSLWGDFDAPVGGVIGARWDDSNTTTVVMENVTVAARLDVYNDVTSTYQWYAYRRAGMLIGNTDTPPADGKNSKVATAAFLTCSNVTVYYGDWVNYHYCEFTNYNSSWPWVRVEAGENCSAFSNPRYGVPTFDGVAITDIDHVTLHDTGDSHNELIVFNQLYGGGQGVYGAQTHDDVSTQNVVYTVTYMYDGEILGVEYVTDNSTAHSISTAYNAQATPEGQTFKTWVTAGSVAFDNNQIPAGHTNDVVLYPSYENIYTARWIDEDGNVIFSQTFTNQTANFTEVAGPVSSSEYLEFDHWEVRNADGSSTSLSEYNIKSASGDIAIYPYYNIKEGGLGLTGVDVEGDGIIDYYTVEAVSADNIGTDINIPGDINGKPVKVVTDLTGDWASSVENVIIQEGVEEINAQAFGDTMNLKTVELPSTITKIENSAFAGNLSNIGSFVGYEKVLNITYNGTKADWDKVVANSNQNGSQWEDGLAKGTTVVCTDGTYTLTNKSYSWSSGNYTYDWTWTPNATN
ncbi:MAG: leucine-rich repeat protein [Clostridia bacterium]|nr:leucine-rich repeat protein [Clostridia bacterium]